MKKRLLSMLAIMAMIISMVSLFAMPASAASYPLVYMSNNNCTIVKGTTGTLEFTIFPEYKNEKYHVFVYDSNNNLIGSKENSYYNGSGTGLTRDISISIDTTVLGMDVGKYKVIYYMSFYSFYEWHDAPNQYSGYFTVVPNTCNGNHNYNVGETYTEGSCTSKGRTKFTCKTCGFIDITEGDYAHTWDNGNVIVFPSCSTTGTKEYTCTKCDETKTETIAATGHRWDNGAVTTPATCKTSGVKSYTCSTCGTVKTETIAQLPHQWDAGKLHTAPTAGNTGITAYTCTKCGLIKHEKIAAIFKDVKAKAYYEAPVTWAYNNKITTGTAANTFSPEATCTRGQVVTFLWRAVGCPEPQTTVNPFTDVKSSQYYYKAVLWAYENGITTGISADKFGPNKSCTRGHVVTFLWRTEKQPAATTAATFTDVKANQYYYNAVSWAVENSITNGIGNGKFAPNDSCTRAQIVTFLHRDLVK